MRCPSCGSKVKRSLSRCPSCGEPLVVLRPSFGGAARDVRPQLGYAPEELEPLPQDTRQSLHPALIVTLVVLGLVAIALVGYLIVTSGLGKPLAGVQIDSRTFPDSTFRAVVRSYDADESGALSPEELASITELDCSSRRISTLDGIETLTSLATLRAAHNGIVSVDLTHNTALVDVDLSDNDISTLTLPADSPLARLDVHDNSLGSLDLTRCGHLTSLACSGNQIARLDLSRCTSLVELSQDAGQNVTIPIAPGFFPDQGLRNDLAASFDSDGDGALSSNERSSANAFVSSDGSTSNLSGIAWLDSLTSIDVSGTHVSDIDSGMLPSSLTTIRANNCSLSSVDLQGLSHLLTLSLSGNGSLTELDVSGCPSLTNLDVSSCGIEEIDLSACSNTLAALHCDETLVVSGVIANTLSVFPDTNLRAIIFSKDHNPNDDDLLTPDELSTITVLDLRDSEVSSLAGISRLSSLVSLDCSGVELGSFTCEGLSSLTTLTLKGCGLTSIDLNGSPSLAYLDVSSNSLVEIDFSASTNLTHLDVRENPGLVLIDLTGCDQLLEKYEDILFDETCGVEAGGTVYSYAVAPTEPEAEASEAGDAATGSTAEGGAPDADASDTGAGNSEVPSTDRTTTAG